MELRLNMYLFHQQIGLKFSQPYRKFHIKVGLGHRKKMELSFHSLDSFRGVGKFNQFNPLYSRQLDKNILELKVNQNLVSTHCGKTLVGKFNQYNLQRIQSYNKRQELFHTQKMELKLNTYLYHRLLIGVSISNNHH